MKKVVTLENVKISNPARECEMSAVDELLRKVAALPDSSIQTEPTRETCEWFERQDDCEGLKAPSRKQITAYICKYEERTEVSQMCWFQDGFQSDWETPWDGEKTLQVTREYVGHLVPGPWEKNIGRLSRYLKTTGSLEACGIFMGLRYIRRSIKEALKQLPCGTVGVFRRHPFSSSRGSYLIQFYLR